MPARDPLDKLADDVLMRGTMDNAFGPLGTIVKHAKAAHKAAQEAAARADAAAKAANAARAQAAQASAQVLALIAALHEALTDEPRAPERSDPCAVSPADPTP